MNLWPVDIFRPPLGAAATILLVAAAMLLAFAIHLRRLKLKKTAAEPAMPIGRRIILISLRAAALAALAWLLAGPSRFVPTPTVETEPTLTILADTSASMAENDAATPGNNQPVTRWQALVSTWLDLQFFDQLNPLAQVNVIGFDKESRRLTPDRLKSLTPDGKASNYFIAINTWLTSRPTSDPPGILLILGDGHDTAALDNPATRTRLADSGWQLLTVPVGQARTHPDSALTAAADADTLFEGQSTTIHATIAHTGPIEDATTLRVELVHRNRTIDSRQIDLASSGAATVQFPVTPEHDSGQPLTHHDYLVRVAPLPGEDFLDNNSRHVFLQVHRQRMKIAMFEGRPYWDTAFLAHILRDDEQADLTAFYAMPGGRLRVVGSAANLPDSAAQITQPFLDQFDLIVLGKGVEAFFPGDRAALLVHYVKDHGGSLILARDRPFDPSTDLARQASALFAEIEPVEWGAETLTDLGLRVTEEGKLTPLLDFEKLGKLDALVTRLPGMIAATSIQRRKSATVVMMEQQAAGPGPSPQNIAALVHQHVGNGRVLAVLGEGLWRWAFGPEQRRDLTPLYQMFWARTTRWLVGGEEFLPGQSIALTLSRLSAQPDEPVTVTVATRFAEPGAFNPTVQLIDPDGQTRQVTLTRQGDASNRYQGTVRATRPGVYSVQLSAPGHTPDQLSSPLAIYDHSIEKLDTSARPATLIALAESAHGRCLGLADRQQLLDLLAGMVQVKRADPRIVYVFDNPAVLALIVGCFGLEWFIRRRWGLA